MRLTDLNLIDQFQGFLNTPDIFSNTSKANFKTFEFPELEINRSVKESLEQLAHPRNSVLGKRMESFFEIAINQSSRYDLMASNTQVIEDKHTLGELDFLLFDNKHSRPLHVELVYKLYVYDESFSPEIKRWIGPNRRDSFYEKMFKLKERQFPLLYKSETSKYLKKLGIAPEDIDQQLCFKAQLFTPEKLNIKNENTVNPEGFIGTWYTLEEFLMKDWKNNLFYSPKKKDWSCDPRGNKTWVNYSELITTVKVLFENKKAPLIWMKTGNSYYRFFIVWW